MPGEVRVNGHHARFRLRDSRVSDDPACSSVSREPEKRGTGVVEGARRGRGAPRRSFASQPRGKGRVASLRPTPARPPGGRLRGKRMRLVRIFSVNKKPPDPDTGLVESIRDGLPDGVELDEREEALLDLAARQPREWGVEADISTRGYLVSGSRGGGPQPLTAEFASPGSRSASSSAKRSSRDTARAMSGRTSRSSDDYDMQPWPPACFRRRGEQPEPLAGQVERHMNARVHGMPARLSYA